MFSCISGILGIIVVAWYGLADVPNESYDASQDTVVAETTESRGVLQSTAKGPGETATVVPSRSLQEHGSDQ